MEINHHTDMAMVLKSMINLNETTDFNQTVDWQVNKHSFECPTWWWRLHLLGKGSIESGVP